MAPFTIVILTHALQGKAEGYFIAAVAARWEAAGHRVLVHQGLGTPPPGDLAILHVDMTRPPADYVALARRYPVALNAGALDIGKRRVSRNLVTPDDTWSGPVIVKTDGNAGGTPDRVLRAAENRQRGRWRQRLWQAVADRLTRRPAGDDYAIHASKAAVPGWVWRHPDLVVERFLPQRHGENYVLNSAFISGRHGIVSAFATREPLVKIARVREVFPLHGEIPPAVWAAARNHGLDLGKIDYVIHQGEAQVLDVNPTPHLGLVWDKSERLERILATLAAGLDDVLAAAPARSAG